MIGGGSAAIDVARSARRAGSQLAMKAVPSRTSTTATNVAGSVGRTSYSTADMTRVRRNAPATPAATPTNASTIPCLTMSRNTDPGEAPSATRTPISCFRWLTAYASTP